MAVIERPYSAEDLLKLSAAPEYDEQRLELSDGELIIMAPASAKHGVVAMRLGRFVDTFVDNGKLGYVTAAETGYILFKSPNGRDTVRAPDVGFIALDHLPEGLPDGYVPVAPDLAIEVVSPNDSASDLQKKVNQYLRAGTKLVWIAYPDTRAVMVFTAEGSHTLDENAALDGGDVLPGFTLPIKSIFA